jgi:hypothetical protein
MDTATLSKQLLIALVPAQADGIAPQAGQIGALTKPVEAWRRRPASRPRRRTILRCQPAGAEAHPGRTARGQEAQGPSRRASAAQRDPRSRGTDAGRGVPALRSRALGGRSTRVSMTVGDELRKTLFLASEVRSGSTYIAESLAYYLEQQFGYSFYGLAKELFSCLDDSSSTEGVLKIYSALFLDKSGWSSSKLMCSSLSIIVRESRRSVAVRSAFFGDETFWIIVRRRDKIKQAVSLAMARKTGLYHYYGDGDESPDSKCQVNKQEIQDALRAIELSDTYLAAFKQMIHCAQYVEIFYEDFLDNEVKFINQVCRLAGFGEVADADAYVNLAKLRPTATEIKSSHAKEFEFWLLENYHPTQ